MRSKLLGILTAMDPIMLPEELLTMVIDFAINLCNREFQGREKAEVLIQRMLLVNRRWYTKLTRLKMRCCTSIATHIWDDLVRPEASLNRYVRSFTDLTQFDFTEGAKQTLVAAAEMYLSAIFTAMGDDNERRRRTPMGAQPSLLNLAMMAHTGMSPGLTKAMLGIDVTAHPPARESSAVEILNVPVSLGVAEAAALLEEDHSADA